MARGCGPVAGGLVRSRDVCAALPICQTRLQGTAAGTTADEIERSADFEIDDYDKLLTQGDGAVARAGIVGDPDADFAAILVPQDERQADRAEDAVGRLARAESGLMARPKAAASKVIEFIEEHCRIPEGRDVGKPVQAAGMAEAQHPADLRQPARHAAGDRQLRPEERQDGVRGVPVVCHICGPQAQAELPAVLGGAVEGPGGDPVQRWRRRSSGLSPTLLPAIVIRDTAKEIFCPGLGTLYKALVGRCQHGLTGCRRASSCMTSSAK